MRCLTEKKNAVKEWLSTQAHQSSSSAGGVKNSRLPALPTTRVPEVLSCGDSGPQRAGGHSTRLTLQAGRQGHQAGDMHWYWSASTPATCLLDRRQQRHQVMT